jgi:4-carboxymuconolactone decarboxylase
LSDPRSKSEGHARGAVKRCASLRDTHVERASDQHDFDEDLQTFIKEGAWDFVWSEPGLSQRDRSMITIAILATLGHYEEIQVYVRGTQNTGVTAADMKETLLHVAIYVGVPAANHAIKIIKKTYAEIEAGAALRGDGDLTSSVNSNFDRITQHGTQGIS